MEIVVNANAGQVAGTVINETGQPVPFAQVTLVPAERNRQDLYRILDVKADGAFEFTGLAPGEYKLFAWPQIEPGAQRDPEFMRDYERFGIAVTVSGGAGPRVAVRVVRP